MAIKNRIQASTRIKGWFLKATDDQEYAQRINSIINWLKGAHFIDLAVRINGKDEREQGDWVKYLEPVFGEEDVT
jgi:hypothetical protein